MVSKARKQLRAKTKNQVNEAASKDLSMGTLKNTVLAEMSGWGQEKVLDLKEGLMHGAAIGAGIGAGARASKLSHDEPTDSELLQRYDNVESESINHSVAKGHDGYDY